MFYLCGDGKHLSNKERLIKIRNFLEVEVNACAEIPKCGWNMDNLETEGRSLPQENQIFRVIYGKIGFLICTENPTFHPQDGNIQETKVSCL